MIVVDTSVVVAIVTREDDANHWIARFRLSDDLHMPASCYLEAVMVLSRFQDGRGRLDVLMAEYGIEILGSDAAQARLAADAFARYGRGSGHPAKLNFGDCLAYAAARARRAPLLFKGAEFGHTDLAPVA